MEIYRYIEFCGYGNPDAERFKNDIARVIDSIPLQHRKQILDYYAGMRNDGGSPKIHFREFWAGCPANVIAFGQVMPEVGEEINYKSSSISLAYCDQRDDVVEILIAHELAHAYQFASGYFDGMDDSHPILSQLETEFDRHKKVSFWAEKDADARIVDWGYDLNKREQWKNERYGVQPLF